MNIFISAYFNDVGSVDRELRHIFEKASNFKLTDKDVATFVDIASLNYDWFVYTYSVKDSYIVKVDGEEDFLYETYYMELTCNSFSDELALEITKAFEEYYGLKLYYEFSISKSSVSMKIYDRKYMIIKEQEHDRNKKLHY